MKNKLLIIIVLLLSFGLFMPPTYALSDDYEDKVANIVDASVEDDVINIHPTKERINELNKVAAEAFIEKQKPENHNNILSKIHKYRNITPDQFLKELIDYTDWINSYGAGFVNKNYFIYDILGQKKYDYNSSKEILQKLINDGTLIVKKESHDNKDIDCISIKEKKTKSTQLRP